MLDDGQLTLADDRGRPVPLVDVDGLPQFSCTVEAVPADAELGFSHLVRFFAGGNLAVTIRLEDVEQVLCTSPDAGTVNVADLTSGSLAFEQRPLSALRGTLAAMVHGA